MEQVPDKRILAALLMNKAAVGNNDVAISLVCTLKPEFSDRISISLISQTIEPV